MASHSFEQIKEAVINLAALLHDGPAFRARAKALALELGSESISSLKKLYHGEPIPPDRYAAQFSGLGAWLSARQFAVFELYYNFKHAALPELRSVAFGPYDWIQGNAVEVLCRLAAAGVERDTTLAELKREIPKMFYEAHCYAIGPLLSMEESVSGLKDVVAELRTVKDFDDVYVELSQNYKRRQSEAAFGGNGTSQVTP